MAQRSHGGATPHRRGCRAAAAAAAGAGQPASRQHGPLTMVRRGKRSTIDWTGLIRRGPAYPRCSDRLDDDSDPPQNEDPLRPPS